jgi:hypothetical protein
VVKLVVPSELSAGLRRIRGQALRYVRECTALRVADDRVAIIADHRILPLSWTRDAYYQALLMLAERRSAIGGPALVADHLRWLWLSCDRPTGAWARSHHANGRRKDEPFQADQQLYPLLELADYWHVTGRLPELGGDGASDRQAWSEMVNRVLRLVADASAADGLLPSDENAADDALALPYHLSTQILAWFCLRRLSALDGTLDLPAGLAEAAEGYRRGVTRHFRRPGPDGVALLAYAVDGREGGATDHDANDLPTALAPLWGFCALTDPLWRATMDHVFSPRNGTFVAGPFGGLGSHHTPGTWALGLVQEWVARSLVGDESRAGDALRRLIGVAHGDVSLPEASDPLTGRARARPWFAWPGAVAGAVTALDEHEAWDEWRV